MSNESRRGAPDKNKIQLHSAPSTLPQTMFDHDITRSFNAKSHSFRGTYLQEHSFMLSQQAWKSLKQLLFSRSNNLAKGFRCWNFYRTWETLSFLRMTSVSYHLEELKGILELTPNLIGVKITGKACLYRTIFTDI